MHHTDRRIALVPTMGALHEGHVALMRAARSKGAALVVSIYLNPTQFGPNDDYKTYPRDFEADQRVCAREEVDVIFAPSDDEMYPSGASTWVEEETLTTRLEGEQRPGHFRGVCTVVSKLFNIVNPDLAVFGEKDYQQLRVIQRLVRDLLFAVEIVAVPTVRDADGVAVSSRNRHLDAHSRAQATVLFKALSIAQDLFEQGERNTHRLQAAMVRAIELAPAARLDYAEIVDADTLQPRPEARRGDVALVASYINNTRLIDHLRF